MADPAHDYRAAAGGAGRPVAGSGGQAAQPAAPPDIRDLEMLAHWMDTRFRVPGTGLRFGLDSLLGLLPGVGDAATALPAAYILLRAHRMGVPRTLLVRMGWNVAMDLAIGAIPVVGDVFDLGFKANRRNIGLLRQHFGSASPQEVPDPIQGSV